MFFLSVSLFRSKLEKNLRRFAAGFIKSFGATLLLLRQRNANKHYQLL